MQSKHQLAKSPAVLVIPPVPQGSTPAGRREAVLAPWDGWEAARSFTGRCFGAGFGLEGRTLHPTRWGSRRTRTRSGRTNKKYRAAEGTARFGRPWTVKGCRPWSSPAAGRRRLPSPRVGTVATCAVKAARPDAKAPGPGWGLERRPFVRSRRLRPAHSLRITQSAVPATYHNPDCAEPRTRARFTQSRRDYD